MKKAITFPAITLALLILLSSCGKSDRLSDEKINLLRAEYPLIDSSAGSAEFVFYTLEKCMKWNQFYVEAEVLEALPDYYIEASADFNDGKTVQRIKFRQFKVKIENVIYDNGENKISDEIIISCNYSMVDILPAFKPGDRYMLPLVYSDSEKHEGKYMIGTFNNIFYIADEYVISAYKEEKNDNYTGMRADDFKNKVAEFSDDSKKS